MADEGDYSPHSTPEKRPEKRLEEIFGDDPGVERHGTEADERAREDWYRENRPPHHDGP